MARMGESITWPHGCLASSSSGTHISTGMWLAAKMACRLTDPFPIDWQHVRHACGGADGVREELNARLGTMVAWLSRAGKGVQWGEACVRMT
jgi:hypothetical protein